MKNRLGWLLAKTRALLFDRDKLDTTLNEEIEFHIDAATEENIRTGMRPEDARRQALLSFGGVDQAREHHRDARSLPLIENAFQDLRFTFRTLGRDARFTTFALLIIAIGVGATLTVFSVINALLLRPLPFRDPAHLVWLSNGTGPGLSDQTLQVSHLVEFRQTTKAFEDVAAYFAFYGAGDDRLTGRGEPERLTNVPVSQNFFQVLGVQPSLGRLFTAEECKWNGPKVILLSHAVWERRFASDHNIVGHAVILNDNPVTIVGVLPPSFDFAAVFAPGTRADVFSPFPLVPETNRWGNTLAVIGRIRPEVSLAAAQAEATVIAKHNMESNPNRNTFEPHLRFLPEEVSGRFRTALWLLAGAVGLVMLIVCANLSNLLLARTMSRQREIAIRAALGAGQGRLLRQLLTESLVLSCGGAALGLAVALIGMRLLSHLDAISIPLLNRVALDWRVALLTAGVAIATGLLFGLAPALYVSRGKVSQALKQASRGSSSGKGHEWLRRALVITEVALACVLLIGSGLLIRSFLRVLEVNLGFRPENAIAFRIDPGAQWNTRELRDRYVAESLRLANAAPGVEAAGLVDNLPLGRNRSWGVRAVGVVYERNRMPDAFVRMVTDGYFRAMGVSFAAGRDFTERDQRGSEPVAIVNETLARALWPGQDAIGRWIDTDINRRVVGIVKDVRHLALEQEAGNEVYMPIRQTGDVPSLDLVVRGNLGSSDLASGVRQALRPLDPNIPGGDFRTLRQVVDRAVSPRRFVVWLLAGFTAFSLVIASLGIYAVISYSVTQRRQEIGIRIALGASSRELQQGVLAQTLRLALAGMVIGGILSLVLSQRISALLYGITPNDPPTFAGMTAILITVAAFASWLPARRASRLDPMAALRTD